MDVSRVKIYKIFQNRTIPIFVVLTGLTLLSVLGCRLDDNQVRGQIGLKPQVNFLNSTSKTDQSLSLAWKIDSESLSQAVQITYLEGTTPPEDCHSGTLLGEFSGSPATINNLSPESTYTFRICIKEDLNSSQTLSVTTESYCYGDRLTNTPFANSGELGIDGFSNSNAFVICTSSQLNNIGTNSTYWDKFFQLQSNIDISTITGTDYNMIGNGTTKFTGSFNGNNYTITGLTYTDTGKDHAGFFGEIDSPATISNIKFSNVNLNIEYNSAVLVGEMHGGNVTNIQLLSGALAGRWSCVGSIVGSMVGGSISNVSSSVDVSFIDGYAGGIAGCVSGTSTIDKASFNGNFNYTNATADYTGGIVGYLSGGTLSNSSVVTSLSAPTAGAWGVGGAVGVADNSSTIDKVFAVVDLTLSTCCGNASHGLLIGDKGSTTILNSYYSTDSNCPTCSTSAGTGQTDSELKQETTFSGWDFNSIWQIDESVSFPYLRP